MTSAMQTMPTRPFGVVLGQRRKEAGLSMQRLAKRTGVSHTTVSRWEAAGRKPKRRSVLALAGALSLGPAQTDELLLAAGFAPSAYQPEV